MTDAPPADMMQRRCPACNSPILPDAKFCESCGAKIEPIRLCVNCGAPLPPDAKFCETCGKPVGKPLSGEKPTKPVTTPIPAAPEPVKPVIPSPEPAAVIPVKQEIPAPKDAPKKPVSAEPAVSPVSTALQQALPTKKNIIIAGVILVVAVLISVIFFVVLPMMSSPAAGNTASGSFIPSLIPATTSAATTSPTAGSLSTGNSLVPGPTQTLPPNQELFFQIDKDTISGDVTVTVSGPSRNVVNDIEVKLTRADGQVEIGYIQPNQKVNEVTLPGTRNTERVEVMVQFYSGEQYKVIDKLVAFNKRIQ